MYSMPAQGIMFYHKRAKYKNTCLCTACILGYVHEAAGFMEPASTGLYNGPLPGILV